MGERFGGEDPATGSREGETDEHRQKGEKLDLASVGAVLDHARRRTMLRIVSDVGAVSTDDLAARIAAWEQGVSPQAVTDERQRSVRIALHHVHVPKLADHGVVEFDAGTKCVHPGPNAEEVRAALRALCTETDGETGPTGTDASN